MERPIRIQDASSPSQLRKKTSNYFGWYRTLALVSVTLLLSSCQNFGILLVGEATPMPSVVSATRAATVATVPSVAPTTVEPTLVATSIVSPESTVTPQSLSDTQIANLLRPSTVRVISYITLPNQSQPQQAGNGTGVVFADEGKIYISTNAHVVAGSSRITIVTDDSTNEREARLVGINPCEDLAIIETIEAKDTSDLKPATFGSSAALQQGEEVIAIGYPIGIKSSFVKGNVSSTNIPFENHPSTVQHSALIEPGYSGGPLSNRRGEVVGFNTWGFGDNLKFSISIDYAIKAEAHLKQGEKSDWFGWALEKIRFKDGSYHLLVLGIEPDSSAAKAGLAVGDEITSFQGEKVQTLDQICTLLDKKRTSDEVQIGGTRESTDMGGVLTVNTPSGRNEWGQLSSVVPIHLNDNGIAQARSGLQDATKGFQRVIFETFDRGMTTRRSWQENNNLQLINKYYRLIINEPNTIAHVFWTQQGQPQPMGDKYVVELKVAFATFEGTSGAGISFDGQPNGDFSAFVIRRDNTWQVVTMRDGKVASDRSGGPMPVPLRGDTNRLRVVRYGEQVSLWVNDTPVASTTSIGSGGNVGVAALGAENITSPAAVIVDEFLVTAP